MENKNLDLNPEESEDGFVTLSLDDGSTMECAVLTIFEVECQDYIALLPIDENGNNEEGEVFLYRFFEPAEGEIDLQNIESDEEFEKVSDRFDELLDEAEFDELVEDDILDDME